MSKNKRLISSLIINSFIFIFVVFGAVMSLGSFWPNKNISLEGNDISNLKYYTWQSNLFAGITSLIMVVFQILVLIKKKEKIPFIMYVFKYVAVVALLVTFITVLFVFIPIILINNNFVNMYANTNFFFHLIIPVLGFISFVFFDDQPKYKFRFQLLSTNTVLIYGLYYLINVLIHLNEDLTVDSKYDWYGYASNGIAFYPVSFIVTFGIGLFSAFILNFLSQLVQRKLFKDEK